MSLNDLVVCAGKGVAAASGTLTYTNSAIQAGDVCLASLNIAVGTATTIVGIRCIVAAGSVAITGVIADGTAVAAATPFSFIVVRPNNAQGSFF